MSSVAHHRHWSLIAALAGMALAHSIGGQLPAAVLFRDDFNGSLSDEWTILREYEPYYDLQPSCLDLMADTGDLFNFSNDARNVFLIDNPTDGDFIATMHLSFVPTSLTNAPQITMLAYDDDNNHVRCGYGSFSPVGWTGGPYRRALELAYETNGSFTYTNEERDFGDAQFYLRLEKIGNVYTQYSSVDGTTFLQANSSITYGDGTPARLGFVAMVEKSTPSHAFIDSFEVRGLALPTRLIWDEQGPGNWSQPRWIGDVSVPDEGHEVEVKTDAVTIAAAASARSLAVTSGQLIVEPAGDLTVVEDMTVEAGATIDLSGAITAQSLSHAGALQVAATGNLSVAEDLTVATAATIDLSGVVTAQSLSHAGALQIAGTGNFSIAGDATIVAGATLDLAGTLSAQTLTASGTHTIGPGANLVVTRSLTVDSGLDLTGANLTTNTALTSVVVNEAGSLVLDDTLHGATLSVAGSVQTAGADLTTLNVSGGGLLTTSADATAADATISAGTMRLTDGANLHVATMRIGPTGCVVDTGTGSVEISESLRAGDGGSFSITGGTFRASGSNLADRAQPRTITLSGGLLTLAGAVTPSGAIATWKLDEGAGLVAADSSVAGNDHTGTIAGAAWTDDPQHGTVLSFDGVDDALQIANIGDLDLGDPVTVAMWINTSAKGGKLLGHDNGNGSWFLGEKALYIDATSGAVALTGSGAGTLAGTSNVADGQWHHVAVTFNNSTSPGGQEVYVDGVQDTLSRAYSRASNTGSIVRLGTADFNKGQAYAGLMDDVYFYDRSLTAAEVDDLYAAVNSGGTGDLPNTSFCVTSDSAVHVESTEGSICMGDLTVDGGVAVTFSGAPIRFQNVSGGDLASVAGNVTVAGALSAGNSPGTLDVVGSLTLDAGSVYVWELGESASDLVAVDGDLTLADGWTLQLADAGGTCDASEQLDLFTCTGLLSLGQGTIDPSVVQSSGGWDWSSATIAQDGSRVYLTGLTVVPEPSSLALLLAGGVAGWALLRRRRARR